MTIQRGADKEATQGMGGAEGAEWIPGIQRSCQMPPQGWWILLPGGNVGTNQLPAFRGQ